MNWEMVGAIGEVGGAIAVVLSLLYLARQVRDSSLQDRRTQYGDINRDFLQFTDATSKSASLADLVFRGMRDRDSLSPPEVYRFNSTLLGLFRAQEAMFHYHREGGIHDWGFESYRASMIDIVGVPGIQAYWRDRRHWFSTEFQGEVDKYLQEDSGRLLATYDLETEGSGDAGGDAPQHQL